MVAFTLSQQIAIINLVTFTIWSQTHRILKMKMVYHLIIQITIFLSAIMEILGKLYATDKGKTIFNL